MWHATNFIDTVVYASTSVHFRIYAARISLLLLVHVHVYVCTYVDVTTFGKIQHKIAFNTQLMVLTTETKPI